MRRLIDGVDINNPEEMAIYYQKMFFDANYTALFNGEPDLEKFFMSQIFLSRASHTLDAMTDLKTPFLSPILKRRNG